MSIQVTSNTVEASAQEAAPKVETVEKKSATTHEVEAVETKEESETSKESLLASESDDESNSDSEESEENKPKKVGGFQKKINKMTKRLSDKDREIEYLKGLVAKTGSLDKEPVEVKKTEPQAANDGKPHPDNFETHADYIDAVTDWKLDQRDKARAEESKAEAAKSDYEKSKKTHQERLNKFRQETKDFNQVVSDFIEDQGEDASFSLAVENLIYDSELGPALIYEMAKNPEEFKRINSLGPLAAAREIGKLEVKLSKTSESLEEKPEVKKLTKASAPISPVGSKGAGSSKKSIFDPDLTQAEYEKLRREQLRA